MFLIFRLHRSACGILVPRPGIEPTPPAVEAWNLNHWTAREVPLKRFINKEDRSQISSLAFYLKELEKEEQTKPKQVEGKK